MKIQNYLDDLYNGRIKHIKTGYSRIDDRFGGLRRGTFSTFGAYSGAGKTFLVINLLNNLVEDETQKLKIGVFSTEMSEEDYETRWLAQRMGIYQLDLENMLTDPLIKDAKMEQILQQDEILTELRDKNSSVTIHGMTNKLEDIIKIQSKAKYDLMIIDFVQDLIVQDKYKPEDTMPITTQEIMKLLPNTHLLLTSQINNKHVENPTLGTFPFAFGVELGRKSALNVFLKFYKSKEGKVKTKANTPYIDFEVLKNRYGQEGHELLIRTQGHKFHQPTLKEFTEFKDKLSNDEIY